jgi:hypothetical protein
MVKVSAEKREKTRILLNVPVACTLSMIKDDESKKVTVDCTTFDFSESGISFYTNRQLCEGDTVDILSNDLWNEIKTGKVRWCKTLDFKHYLVGVSFQ